MKIFKYLDLYLIRMTLQSELPLLLALQKPFLLIALENIGLAGRHTFPGLRGAPSGNGALIAVQTAIMSCL
jgi:hypothetical protein